LSLLSPPKKTRVSQEQIVATQPVLAENLSEANCSRFSWTAFLRERAFAQFRHIQHGGLVIREKEHAQVFGQANRPSGEIVIHNPRCYRRLVLGGPVGAAESFIDGDWSTPDLLGLLRIFARNEHFLHPANHGFPRMKKAYYWLFSRLRRNTRKGSRRNIAAHYDLGNDFFSQFLDPSMTYSCGIFDPPESSLWEASMQKYRVIANGLNLSPSDHVIEIGTGWGGFALFAAEQYGCHITTTTISKEQYNYVTNKVKQAKLNDKITVICKDYRDLKGTFDKLVSIEMIEAVGHQFLKTFFKKCGDLLKPSGQATIQAITVPDKDYSRYRRSTDFIQHFVFPGGCLPSIQAIRRATGNTDLELVDVTDFSNDYFRTLSEWRSRFKNNLSGIKKLKLGEQFIRLWDYYLCYCAGGFAEGKIHVGHISLQKSPGTTS